MEWAATRLAELARGRVLDAGCGEGRYLPARGFGIDLEFARLRVARERSVRIAVADVHRLPFGDGTFDTVFANRMLNDAGRIDDALRELRRVLRTGGRLVVLTRARPGPGDRLDAENGAVRLSPAFSEIRIERSPEDQRLAVISGVRV